MFSYNKVENNDHYKFDCKISFFNKMNNIPIVGTFK